MSDCSTNAFDEYPGVKRIGIVKYDDGTERDIGYPFVAIGKEVVSIEIDGVIYEPKVVDND